MTKLNDDQKTRLLKISRNLNTTPEDAIGRILDMTEAVINLKLKDTRLIIMVPVDANGDFTKESPVACQPLPFNFTMLGEIREISYDDNEEVISIPFVKTT